MTECEGVGLVEEIRKGIPRSHNVLKNIFQVHAKVEASECCLVSPTETGQQLPGVPIPTPPPPGSDQTSNKAVLEKRNDS